MHWKIRCAGVAISTMSSIGFTASNPVQLVARQQAAPAAFKRWLIWYLSAFSFSFLGYVAHDASLNISLQRQWAGALTGLTDVPTCQMMHSWRLHDDSVIRVSKKPGIPNSSSNVDGNYLPAQGSPVWVVSFLFFSFGSTTVEPRKFNWHQNKYHLRNSTPRTFFLMVQGLSLIG